MDILVKAEDIKITYTTSLPNGVINELKAFAYNKRTTANAVILEALREFIDHHNIGDTSSSNEPDTSGGSAYGRLRYRSELCRRAYKLY